MPLGTVRKWPGPGVAGSRDRNTLVSHLVQPSMWLSNSSSRANSRPAWEPLHGWAGHEKGPRLPWPGPLWLGLNPRSWVRVGVLQCGESPAGWQERPLTWPRAVSTPAAYGRGSRGQASGALGQMLSRDTARRTPGPGSDPNRTQAPCPSAPLLSSPGSLCSPSPAGGQRTSGLSGLQPV